MTIRVLLADDHPMFLFGLRAVLDQADGIEVVGEAADGDALLAIADRCPADVVLTDLTMSGVDGVTVIERLAATHPALPVIAMTMHADEGHVRAALRAGARGYLLKGADGVAIARAIESAASGHLVLDPSVGTPIVTAYAGGRDSGSLLFPDLTARETDVLRLLSGGCGNHEIARRLGLAEKTVRNLTSSVLIKLGVPDRTSAALRAKEAGLSSEPG
ncbi:MAG: response regulator transcription factor [Nocardioides sp.]